MQYLVAIEPFTSVVCSLGTHIHGEWHQRLVGVLTILVSFLCLSYILSVSVNSEVFVLTTSEIVLKEVESTALL